MARIAFLGGTGPEGLGLAMRFAIAGEHVIIGSRQEERAAQAAATVSQLDQHSDHLARTQQNALHGFQSQLDDVLSLRPDIVFLPDEPFLFTEDDAEGMSARVIGPFPGHLFTWHGTRTILGLRFLHDQMSPASTTAATKRSTSAGRT